MIRALLVALSIAMTAVTAHAAPICVRPSPVQDQSVRQANSFAQTPPPQAIAPGRGRCGWGLGLARAMGGTGTAFIVADRREVMTALHVVDPRCAGNRRFTFEHGFNGGRALSIQTATVVARGDYCATLARGRHDYSGDWAIAVLSKDPRMLEPTAARSERVPLGLDDGGNWLGRKRSYYLLGYSMSFRRGIEPYSSGPCRLARLFALGVVEHDCDANRRASGAPIVTENAAGGCLVAAMHVGEIAEVRGRPAYRDGVNANVAVLANDFAQTAGTVAHALAQGWSASEIAADLDRRPTR